MKILLIIVGLLFLGLGFIGIVIPGLPTTPFLLLATAMFVRSSDRLYNWVLQNKYCCHYIKAYREHKAIPQKAKTISLITMWSMILLSVFVFIPVLEIKFIVLVLGVIGTIVLLIIPTIKEKNE